MKYLLPFAGVSILLVLTSSISLEAHAAPGINPAAMTANAPTALVALDLLQDSEHGEDESVSESHEDAAPVGQGANGDEGAPHDTADGGHEEAGEHDAPDLGQQRAAKLAVLEPPSWYGKVVWGAGLLFVLAATLGSAAIVVKGPEPPDPADDQGHH